MATPQNGQSAARNARLAQGAAVVLVATVGVLGAVGIPGLQAPEAPAEMHVNEVEIKMPRVAGAVAQPVDYASLTNRLSLLENAPKLPDAPVAEAGTTEPPPPPPPPPPAVKYLGPARVGPLVLALVSDGGKQRFVKAGDRLSDDSKIKQVLDGEIVVEKSGGEEHISLSERVGALTTSGVNIPNIVGAGNVTPLGVTGRPGFPRAPGAAASLSPKDSFIRTGYTKDGTHYFDARGNLVTDPDQILLRQYRQKVEAAGEYKSDDDIDAAAKKLFEMDNAERGQQGKGNK
ncbi:MAG: hypothetical protein WC718_09700 [Phycisphaerales bacterium]|jgi:hypothetical protein